MLNRKMYIIISIIIVVIIIISVFSLNFLNSNYYAIKSNNSVIKVAKVELLSNVTTVLVGNSNLPYSFRAYDYVGINTNLWNLGKNSKGNVMMNLNGSTLNVVVNFTKAMYLGYPSVLGYPEILYGVDVWGSNVPPPSNLLFLPQPLYNISNNTLLLVKYLISDHSGTPIDFAYDIWIVKNVTTAGATHGDIELMIWLDDEYGMVPAGKYVTTVKIPLIINGNVVISNFLVYVDNGTLNPWTIITFKLDSPISNGSVGISLGYFVKELTKILVNYFNWNENYINNLMMQTIDIGSEFRQNPYGGAQYTFTIYDYSIEIVNRFP
ncbi:MAG: hypothetical protein QW232_08925 [Saccharolobus sp.]